MYKYVLKRLLLMIPVILGVSFIVFTILNITPGDPVTIMLGENADPAKVAEWRALFGLDKPFLERYFDYIIGALHGDFGVSYTTRMPVVDEIAARFPTTLKLALGAVFLQVLIGVPLGIMSAVKQYSTLDYSCTTFALIFTSMPGFWLGLMMVLIFSVKLGWLPAIGADEFKNFLMPWFTIALSSSASLMRMTRSTMLEVIRQDYIRTARAKGARERTIIFKHELRNALLPVITVIGLNMGVLLGGTMITESVFAMPGIGSNIITAVRQKNTPMVLTCVLMVAVLAGLINLLVDIIYAYVDPRIKSQYVKS